MSAQASSLVLPARLDLKAAVPLRDDLLAVRGAPVTLDGSAVLHLGASGLQVLLAAAETWRAEGLDFQIIEPSAAFQEGLRQMGASSSLLAGSGALPQ